MAGLSMKKGQLFQVIGGAVVLFLENDFTAPYYDYGCKRDIGITFKEHVESLVAENRLFESKNFCFFYREKNLSVILTGKFYPKYMKSSHVMTWN